MALDLYYQDIYVTLYLGDALEGVRTLTYDALATSPPYNLGGSSGRWQNSKSTKALTMKDGYKSFNDQKPWPEYYAQQQELILAAWNRLPKHGTIWWNHKHRIDKGIGHHPIQWWPSGVPLRQEIVWDRDGFGINYNERFLLPTHEVVLLAARPDWKLEPGECGVGTVWSFKRSNMKKDHPAPWPDALGARLVKLSHAKVILDPYAGSGTLLRQARRQCVHSIGVEISEQYCEGIVKTMKRRVVRRGAA